MISDICVIVWTFIGLGSKQVRNWLMALGGLSNINLETGGIKSEHEPDHTHRYTH